MSALAWAFVSICWILWELGLSGNMFPGNKLFVCGKVPLFSESGTGRSLLFFHPIDVNRATPGDLMLIPGIGEKRACEIICFRQNMGFILSLDELSCLKGPLSPGLLDAIRPFLSVGGI